jgi:hypothetical protein
MFKLAWRPPRIDYTVHVDHWVYALASLDRFGDKKPLCKLLRDCDLSPEVGEYLADLIERRNVPLPNGHPRTPAYTIGDHNMDLSLALNDVSRYRRSGMSLEAALEKAANEWGLDIDTLRLSRQGRHTSLRRAKK